MSDNTSIEWADATWNVVIGCDKVSPGCDHCYAIRTAHRMQANPNPKIAAAYAGTEADGEWTGKVNMLEDRLDIPLRWTRGRRIFVNAQSDLFHREVTDEFIARVFVVMAHAQQHTFQILTKRPARMRSLLSSPGFAATVSGEVAIESGAQTEWPLPNVWVGVSIEDEKRADLRLRPLLDTPAAVRFLSMEPLLGPVDLINTLGDSWLTDIDWVIVGGESGPGARPMRLDWVRSLRDQCEAAFVPFLFKQWGDRSRWVDKQGDVWSLSDDGLMETPETALFSREHVERKWGPLRPLGKKAAGRELDGRSWDEFPAAAEVAS